MGGDIVLAIEYSDDDNRWRFLAEVSIPRDYLLFAVICGARNAYDGVEPVAELKGHPDNLAPATKYVMDGGDVNETWLSYVEWLTVMQQYKEHAERLERGGYFMQVGIVGRIMLDAEHHNMLTITRVVIAFN